MRWLVVLGCLAICNDLALAQVRRLVRGDWVIEMMQNAWTHRYEGAAVSPAVSAGAAQLVANGAAAVIACAGGRARLGIRWPVSLGADDAPIYFMVSVDQSEPRRLLFQRSHVLISRDGAAGATYISTDEELELHVLRGRSLVMAPSDQKNHWINVSLKGFQDASFDIKSLCSGRTP